MFAQYCPLLTIFKDFVLPTFPSAGKYMPVGNKVCNYTLFEGKVLFNLSYQDCIPSVALALRTLLHKIQAYGSL